MESVKLNTTLVTLMRKIETTSDVLSLKFNLTDILLIVNLKSS